MEIFNKIPNFYEITNIVREEEGGMGVRSEYSDPHIRTYL